MKRTGTFPLLFITSVFFFLNGCKKDTGTTDRDKGHIVLKFACTVDTDTLQFNKMIYTNAAGNVYGVTDIKWFISDIIFYPAGKSPYMISKQKDIYYLDTEIPSTLRQVLADEMEPGNYDSITFIFGITWKKNVSYMFVNLPESNMFWPELLGGGYHYMMLNGFWNDTLDEKHIFNFHLGIGRVITPSDTSFVQNYFKVKLDNSSFTLDKGKTKEIQIIMDVAEWFKNPFVYNHNYWGGAIMENQDAMTMARENGKVGVFRIGYIRDL